MNVTYLCPQCEQATRSELSLETSTIMCHACQHQPPLASQALQGGPETDQAQLQHCLICGNEDLFIRKDFSQRLGILIIAIGFTASSIAWYHYWTNTSYLILFCSALLDLALYSIVGNLLRCYRCNSEFRGLSGENHSHFDLELHERYRQQAARLAELQAFPGEPPGSSQKT
ncbi:MAG: hypothetical protein GY917_13835 [Planctomycetaceae bacterium]|nr:hypothetical protein [Planctomycetaceae bacterium]